MKPRPLIGLTPYEKLGDAGIWMRGTYIRSILNAGGLPVTLPFLTQEEEFDAVCRSMDGFLFTGGDDIDPAQYGEAILPECGELCPARDAFELRLLPKVLAAEKPMLAICRGVQVLNVALGGTLYQDLPSQLGQTICHDQEQDFEKPAHDVSVAAGTRLREILQTDTLAVNTWHHQAIRTLGQGLIAGAIAPDGVIEAVELPGAHMVLGVQWHPEYLDGTPSENLFRALIDEAGKPVF